MPVRHSSDVPIHPVEPEFNPGAAYAACNRHWQGVPSIARAPNGRLWASWYSGGKGEDNDNYALLVTSEDDGNSWSDPVCVIDPPHMVRAWDPCLWLDPQGRLWWTWTQTCPMPGEVWDGRGSIWAMVTEEPEKAQPAWSAPRRISHGVALNKPLITSAGEWILPMAIWWMFEQFKDLDYMRKPGALCSRDQGVSWEWRGGADIDERIFDEPMIVEKKDGTLWMLMRTRKGIAESFSMDGGYSWSRGRPSPFANPSSRFHFRRLASGRLLLINHVGNPARNRSHLTATLSEDDGCTWPYRLLLDERARVSYPDAAEGPDGVLHVIYDHNRYADREILMARFCEEDIIKGQCHSPDSALQLRVSKAG